MNPLDDAKSHKRVTERLTEIRHAEAAEALRLQQEEEANDLGQEVDDAAEAEMDEVQASNMEGVAMDPMGGPDEMDEEME